MASIKYKTEDGYVSIPMSILAKTNEENGNGIGTCSTSSGTALTVSLTDYELVQNGFVAVTFEHDVPANATLNINSKGAKPIYYKGSAITADTIKADDTVMFCYDGTNYVVTSFGGEISTFTGATSSADGSKGLVPAPTIADKNKFLRGDGTWSDIEDTVFNGHIIIDQTSSNPETMVLDMNNNGYANYQRPEVITAIRNNSHRYVGTFSNGVMNLKQLSDTNGTMYADGTSAATDIATQGKDVFMRLPKFYTRTTEISTDKWKIEFYYHKGNAADNPGQDWKAWGGNDLIGAYEAYASDTGNNGNGGLFSRSGVTASDNVSQANYKIKARNRGTGFSILKWRHHNIMAILFYAYYGNTDSQLIVGDNVSTTSVKTTGLKNALGMTDTRNTGNNGEDPINFWGLENWWGGVRERVDNVIINNGTWSITEDDGTIRTVSNTYGNGGLSLVKILLGDNLDLIPPSNSPTTGTSSTGYCDGYYYNNSTDRIATVSGASINGPSIGISMAMCNDSPTGPAGTIGSRLAYTGPVQIVN